MTFTFDLNFEAFTGTGTFSAIGVYDYGAAGVSSCHVDETFTMYRTG